MVNGRTGLLSLLMALVLIAGCGVKTGDEGKGETFEWDYTLYLGLNHVYGKIAQQFADTVRKRTDGQLDITVRPAGELPYSPDEFVRRTGDGSVEMSDGLGTFIGGDCKVAALPALPMLVPSAEDYARISATVEPELDECLNGYGASLLYTYLFPTQNMWGRGKPVTSLDDVSGKTIRQTSSEHGLFLKSVGAQGVTLVTSEVPSAIQRGVMDGVLTAALNARSSKWDEFLDWGYLLNLGIVPSYISVNTKAYEELPDDVRKVLDDTATEYTKLTNDRSEEAEAAAMTTLETKSGVTINKASEAEIARLEDSMVPVWKDWARKSGKDVATVLEKVRRPLRR